MLHGSFWMIAMRWSIRLIGLVSTVILARLLTPADFGVVAMAMIVVGLLENFSQTGQRLAIIRMPNPTREHYDAAWTLSIIMGLIVGIVIFLIAPLSSHYFNDPRAVTVIQCLALRAVVGGFENIGIVDMRRDLQFNRFYNFNIYSKIISFVATLGLAFWLRNYWALVIGILVQVTASNLLSYILSEYRPRISFVKMHEIRSFSLWTLLRSLGTYSSNQIDLVIIGGISGASQMGRYAVANDVASSPSAELNTPMVAALFPVMATVQNDLDKMRGLYLRTLSWSALICAATSTGVAMVTTDLVGVLLGPQWADTAPLMVWLAFAAGVFALTANAYGTLDNLNAPQVGARMQWVRLGLLALAMIPVAMITKDPEIIAATRLIVTVIFVPSLFFAVGSRIGATPNDYLAILWRPLVAAGGMALAIYVVNAQLPLEGALRLLIDVIVGGITYPAIALGLWWLSGKPPTAEKDAMGMVQQRLKNLKAR